MRKIKSILAWLVGSLIILFILILFIFTLLDFKPDEIIQISNNPTAVNLTDSSTYDFLIWNIGYAGLGEEMDFFYDGGTMTRSTPELVKGHFEAITAFIDSNDTVDFILLQEVDIHAKRSFAINEFSYLDSLLSTHEGFFAVNYNVPFVPVPLGNPLGRVKSGLASFSKFEPVLVERYSFPGNFSWPTRLFMLDRCFQVLRFPLDNGSQLVVINTHNSAYDDGNLRDQQMSYLKQFLLEEENKGNYVVVGGDWNQSPHGFKPEFSPFDTLNQKEVSQDFPSPDWKWAYDNKLATNRRLQTPYEKGKTLTTVIDFYLCSPDVEIVSVQTVDLDFVDTDHQPVFLRIKIH